MKVLWIVNIELPDFSGYLGHSQTVTGGWLLGASQALLKSFPEIELAVACLCNKNVKVKIGSITYYGLPFATDNVYHKDMESFWRKIKDDFQPDIVHIHGLEFPHGLCYLNACGNKNAVASIQGIVNVYARYADGGIGEEVLKCFASWYDKLRWKSWRVKETLYAKGKFENQALKQLKYVIGRTSWDKRHSLAVNPDLKYFVNNETLRPEFYNKSWDIQNIERHALFVSQGKVPLKGFHQLLKAMPLILSRYPDTRIYMAGSSLAIRKDFLGSARTPAYARYVNHLVAELNLESKVHYLGALNANQMSDQLLKSHVFVIPSAIENSPNSLGEAQLLGLPCVGAISGGIPDMIEDNVTGLLYHFMEPEALAQKVIELFDDDEKAIALGKNAKHAAASRHAPQDNAIALKNIYQEMLNEQ